MEVWRLQDIFSILCMHLHDYLNIMSPWQMTYVQNDTNQDTAGWGGGVYCT